jgi:four helix bundle suffix protein
VSTRSTLSTKVYPELAANAVLVLLAVACSLLDRQMARLADEFESKGGFTERLNRAALPGAQTEARLLMTITQGQEG